MWRSKMQTMFVLLFLNAGINGNEGIWPGAMFTVSMIPADLRSNKTIFFFFSGVHRQFGTKTMGIKVAEINAPLN